MPGEWRAFLGTLLHELQLWTVDSHNIIFWDVNTHENDVSNRQF